MLVSLLLILWVFLFFFSLRKDVALPELVYATEANTLIPQMVIKFYESKLTWHDEKATGKRHWLGLGKFVYM